MNDSIKKRFIPKSLKKKDDNSYSDIYYQDGVQQGDAGITLPNKIEHLIHVDGTMSGLPPSWANQLSELGYQAGLDTPTINQHKSRSNDSTRSTLSTLSIPELRIGDEDEDWSGGVMKALERSSISEKRTKRSSDLIQNAATRRSSVINFGPTSSSKRPEIGRRPATADTATRPTFHHTTTNTTNRPKFVRNDSDVSTRSDSLLPQKSPTKISQQRWSPPKVSKTPSTASKQRWEPPTLEEGVDLDTSLRSSTKSSHQPRSIDEYINSSASASTKEVPRYTVPRSFAAAQDQYLSNDKIRKEIDARHGVKGEKDNVYGGLEEEDNYDEDVDNNFDPQLDSPHDVDENDEGIHWDMIKSPSGLSIQLSPLQIDQHTFELSESTTSPDTQIHPSLHRGSIDSTNSPKSELQKKVETRKRSRSSLIVMDRTRRQTSISSTPGSVADEDDLTGEYLKDIQPQNNLDDLVEDDDGTEFSLIDTPGLGINVLGNAENSNNDDEDNVSESSASTAKVADNSMVFDIPTNETTPEIPPPPSPTQETTSEVEKALSKFATEGDVESLYPVQDRVIIAMGMSGHIYQFHNKALKIVQKSNESQRLSNLHNELSIIKSLNSSNILPIEEMFLTMRDGSPVATLVMPLMTRSLTDIISLIDSGLQLNERQIGRIVYDILQALECLRFKQIIHRDVRSDTIMISQNGTSILTDFANAVQAQSYPVSDTISAPFWMAPELVQDGGQYTHKSDVWSLIATTYEMVTGMPPYAEYDEGALFNKLALGLPDLPHETSNTIREFVVRTAVPNSKSRMSSRQILDGESFVDEHNISKHEEISLILEIAQQLEGEGTPE
ncbi:kinase-like protein [Wallemia mellicola]|nr:kinase-like protein [Wallemia mellicola]